MADEAARDLDIVMRYLKDEFSAGQDSVSQEDILITAYTLGETVSRVLEAEDEHARLDPEELAALRCMADTWAGGFYLASRYDHFDDDRTLGEIAIDYVPQAFTPARLP